MNRRECIEAAAACVLKDRNASYGDPEDNFEAIAKLLNAAGFERYMGPISNSDVAILMILLKVARQAHRNSDDNWVDIAGYAACGAEVASIESAELEDLDVA